MSFLRRLLGLDRRETGEHALEEVAGPPAAGRNILVVSDIHLGELSKDRTRIAYLKASSVLDREFCDLLEHYQASSPGDRPWRLVLGGDVIDFLQVTMTPRQEVARDLYGFSVSSAEQRVGLDNDADKVRWKLSRVMDRHRMFFTYLADFVGRGNEVVLVRGNHDAEFFWVQVHQAFRDRLVEIYFADERIEGESPELFADRIRFHPWFYFEPGVLFFEHGHQYDAYSSLEHLLYPVQPWDPRHLEWPAVSLVVRWGVNLIAGMKTHDKDDWAFLDYVRYMFSLRTRQIPRLLRIYTGLCRVVVSYYLRRRRTSARGIRELHDQARRTIAAESGLPDDALDALDRLQARPVHLTLLGALNSLLLDRWALVAADILLAAGLAVASPGPAVWAGAVAVAAVVNVLLLRRMAAALDTWAPPKLRAAAPTVHRLVGTRYVAMGHSHVPEVVPLDADGAAYFNTGSWLHYGEPHAAGAECDCGLVHLVVTAGDPPEAELRRWCVQGRAPVRWVRGSRDPS